MSMQEICQRKDCDTIATEIVEAEQGHPDDRFVFCSGCAAEAEVGEYGYIKTFHTQKLYFYCSECDQKASHNVIFQDNACPYCGHDTIDRL